ncbi:MAG: hypothetical protein ACPGVH_03895 [Chitinophagales bacterium]
MKIESLFDTLKKFSPDDWNDIVYWSESPIYKLKKNIEAKDDFTNSLEKIYSVLFDKIYTEKDNLKNYNVSKFMKHLRESTNIENEDTFRNRLGELKNLYIEKFIGLKMISSGASEIRWQQQTLRYFSEKKLPNHFKNISSKIESKLLKKVNSSFDFYQFSQFYQKLTAYYTLEDSKLSNIYMDLSKKHLSIYYNFKTLILNCEIQNRMLISTKEFEIVAPVFFEIEFLEENSLLSLQDKVFKIQQTILKNYNKTLKKDAKVISELIDENEIEEAIQILIAIDSKDLSNLIDLKTIYYHLLNICRVLIQNGFNYISNFISLVSALENKNLLLQHGRISPNLFKVIIDISLENNEIEFAKDFYAKFKTEIFQNKYNLSDKEEIFKELNYLEKVSLYCNAHILFYEKKYTAALEEITFLKYTKKEFFDIDFARLSIKLYLELQMTDELKNMLRSAKSKLNKMEVDLPFRAKEKFASFISILNTNKIIDETHVSKKSKNKILLASDQKYLKNKFGNKTKV